MQITFRHIFIANLGNHTPRLCEGMLSPGQQRNPRPRTWLPAANSRTKSRLSSVFGSLSTRSHTLSTRSRCLQNISAYGSVWQRLFGSNEARCFGDFRLCLVVTKLVLSIVRSCEPSPQLIRRRTVQSLKSTLRYDHHHLYTAGLLDSSECTLLCPLAEFNGVFLCQRADRSFRTGACLLPHGCVTSALSDISFQHRKAH